MVASLVGCPSPTAKIHRCHISIISSQSAVVNSTRGGERTQDIEFQESESESWVPPLSASSSAENWETCGNDRKRFLVNAELVMSEFSGF